MSKNTAKWQLNKKGRKIVRVYMYVTSILGGVLFLLTEPENCTRSGFRQIFCKEQYPSVILFAIFVVVSSYILLPAYLSRFRNLCEKVKK